MHRLVELFLHILSRYGHIRQVSELVFEHKHVEIKASNDIINEHWSLRKQVLEEWENRVCESYKRSNVGNAVERQWQPDDTDFIQNFLGQDLHVHDLREDPCLREDCRCTVAKKFTDCAVIDLEGLCRERETAGWMRYKSKAWKTKTAHFSSFWSPLSINYSAIRLETCHQGGRLARLTGWRARRSHYCRLRNYFHHHRSSSNTCVCLSLLHYPRNWNKPSRSRALYSGLSRPARVTTNRGWFAFRQPCSSTCDELQPTKGVRKTVRLDKTALYITIRVKLFLMEESFTYRIIVQGTQLDPASFS